MENTKVIKSKKKIEKIQNDRQKKIKKIKRIIIIVLILLVGVGILYSVDKYNKSYHADKLSFKYELLDNSVVLDKEVTKWITNKSKEEGAYSFKNNNSVYVLISQAGKDYNICLNKILENNNSVKIEYEFIKSDNKNSKKQPMLIQIETNKSIKFSKV